MDEYLYISEKNLLTAKKIIEDLNLENIFMENNYKANLIGSVATNLLMDNLDIDFHVYPNIFSIEDIYKIIGKISLNKNITRTSCLHNDLETEYRTLDWHIRYNDEENNSWRIDLIFFKENSPYIGKAEKVVEIINSKITETHKKSILEIKYNAKKLNIEFKGIEIYKAVMECGIKTINEFMDWKKDKEYNLINFWEINL